MRFQTLSDIPGRLRIRCGAGIFDDDEARGVAYALYAIEGVRDAEVHTANGSVLVTFSPEAHDRVLAYLRGVDVLALPTAEVGVDEVSTRVEAAAENNRFVQDVVAMVEAHVARRLLLPAPLATAWAIVRAVPFVLKGLGHLLRGELTVEVLDASAIVASMARGSFSEASTIMFLLTLSARMEEHVQARTKLALRDGIVARADAVWLVADDGSDVRIPISEVRRDQVLHLGAGSVLPVDGTVVAGEGEVNEASMTGEAALVPKEPGSTVYAGTALETGDLRVRVTAPPGAARIDQIVELVEGSAELKAGAQSRAEHLADGLVPYSFAAFFAILAITRNVTKAMAVLMVDYSCAIKLSMPIAVMSAMDEGADKGIVFKGGRYLEALAAADTVVFDKTGTLTHASPHVERVLALGDEGEDLILRFAACVEEHFPHSMARAIVAEARRRGLDHERELHAEVEYVVAHGIRTSVEGVEVCIGSAHFVFEDEGVEKPTGLDERIAREAPTASVVYLAVDHDLVGAICIADPLREEAPRALAALRDLGMERVVMLTGDSERSAAHVAQRLGLDEFHAQVLPEDKSGYVEALRTSGHTVAMVGDGINDSPALAAADVSVAMSDASDIARAVADVAVQDSTLESLVTARVLSQRLMRRIHADYRFIVAFNTTLIALGVAGVVPLTTAAYAHNLSTFAISALNTRPYLRERA